MNTKRTKRQRWPDVLAVSLVTQFTHGQISAWKNADETVRDVLTARNLRRSRATQPHRHEVVTMTALGFPGKGHFTTQLTSIYGEIARAGRGGRRRRFIVELLVDDPNIALGHLFSDLDLTDDDLCATVRGVIETTQDIEAGPGYTLMQNVVAAAVDEQRRRNERVHP